MERVGVLIDRLLVQHNNNANTESLLITTQLLLSELQKNHDNNSEQESSVVSVFYPAFNHSGFIVEEKIAELPEVKQEVKIAENNVQPQPHANEAAQKNELPLYDPMVEIPTLALKQQEVNDAVTVNGESLNDKLKAASSRKEIAHSINTPVKDLRKAIGINDRYVFINELFRGDETMYERSIKTINGFTAHGEAEFWIKRELKLKLGWNDNNDAVQLFDKLVKRRFA